MENKVFGIDLGTTYSCISCIEEETGIPVLLENEEGSKKTPSVVSYSDPFEVLVGESAKAMAVEDPWNTVICVKNVMGKKSVVLDYFGQKISPEEVSSLILKKLVNGVKQLTGYLVKDVVITCPAHFGDAERLATRKACEIADLNVLEIINEPTAAAIYYGCIKAQDEKTILVYDLGGGTFDVTVMHVDKSEIRVICSNGDCNLGGKLWDKAIVEYLKEKFFEVAGVAACQLTDCEQQDLWLQAEKVKMRLTMKIEEQVMVHIGGRQARVSISREIFEELTSNLVVRTLEITGAAMATAKRRGYGVDEIYLSGGSTRMPQIEKALIAKYGFAPKILEPDEAVAKGAAVYAYNVYMKNQKIQTGSVKEKEVKKIVFSTTKSYALEVVHEGKDMCCNMIIKNTIMEENQISITKTFGTYEDNMDDVELIIYENDEMEEYLEPRQDHILGTLILELPSNLPADSPIEVCFSLSRDGVLNVTAKDVVNGNSINTELHAEGIMEKEKLVKVREKVRKIVVL